MKTKKLLLFIILSSCFATQSHSYYDLDEYRLYSSEFLKRSSGVVKNDFLIEKPIGWSKEDVYMPFFQEGDTNKEDREESKIEILLDNSIRMEVSAYTRSKREGTYGGITSSGELVREGFIAGSPDVVRKYGYGRKFHLYQISENGVYTLYGSYVLKDKMNQRYKNTLDIFMNSYNKAMKFGRRKMLVVVE